MGGVIQYSFFAISYPSLLLPLCILLPSFVIINNLGGGKMGEWIVPLSTLIIVLATFVWNAVGHRKQYQQNKMINGSVNDLKKEVGNLENKLNMRTRDLEECKSERRRLLNENIDLMRRLMKQDD
jgi:hypothetical protein